MFKYSESPLSQLPYLELFQSGGGASQGVFGGGQSRDIFRGGPVKKITLYISLLHTSRMQKKDLLGISTSLEVFLKLSENLRFHNEVWAPELDEARPEGKSANKKLFSFKEFDLRIS